jgi:hypothetical protein
MITEQDLLETCRKAFDNRMAAEGVKKFSKKWEKQLETFMQGVLTTATATGAMTFDRANMFYFMCMCGRLAETVGYKKER